MSARRSVLVLGAVMVAGATLWLVRDRPGSQPVPSSDWEPHGAIAATEGPAPLDGVGLVLSADPQRSAAVGRVAMASHVRDPDGRPIAGARVTWTPLRSEFLGVWVGWTNQRWTEIDAATLESVSDGDGAFGFRESLAGSAEVPSVLWATHPGFLPALSYVEAVGGELRFPGVIEMHPAEPIEVRVVDAEGGPVPLAQVEQTTPIPTNALADRFDPQARRILKRSVTTDGEGRAELAAWDGPMLLRATCGALASEIWIGNPRGVIRLELRPTFEAGGAVTLEAGSAIEGEQRIVCQVQKGSQLQPLAVVPVSQGTWGPVTLPLLDVDRYRFRIEGWNAEVHERVLAPPTASATVRVDFTLRAGFDVQTFVQDEEEQPILASTSTVLWDQDGIAVEAKAHPEDNGYAYIRGVPAGVIRVKAEAPGYVPGEAGPGRIPDEYYAFTVGLVRGRRVEGRVLWHGQPVEDFEVSHWAEDNGGQVCVPFRERSDGSFVLEAATTGRLSVCATAQGASPSETVVVAPGDSPPPPLTFELRNLVRGKGRIVDAATGEPLADARIQPFIANRAQIVAPWGPALSVASDGSFDGLSFAPSRQRVRFSAPGHSVHWSETFAEPAGTIDFGTIPLHGRQELLIELVSATESGLDEYLFSASGDDFIGEQRFGNDGRLVIADVGAGRYHMVIRDLTGFELHENVVLTAGTDWRLQFPVGGEHELQITVATDASIPSGALFSAMLPHPEKPGYLVATLVTPDRSWELLSPFPGEYRVELRTAEGATLASQGGVIRPDDSRVPVHLAPGLEAHRFRIVDSSDAPVPRLRLRLYSVDAIHLRGVEETGEDGECSMTGLSPGSHRAYMDHPDLGYDLGKPVDVPPLAEDPIEVVFAPVNVVELQLLDGAEPLPAVSCRIVEEHVSYTLPASASDSAGVVRWEAIGAGRFAVKIQQAGLWPPDAIVEARPAGERTELQVRRLGDLEVSLERVGGGSVAGLVLELESAEFRSSVSTWIADGRVTSSTGSLALDAQGKLVLTGMPRGKYLWAVEGAGGAVEVPPGRGERLVVLLP